MPKLIGITGYARHGKGSVAKILAAHGYTVLSFADPVRQFALALDPMIINRDMSYIRLSDYVGRVGWDYAKQDPEVRRILQRVGTDAAKPIFGQDCWAKIGMRKAADIIIEGGKVCFDDVRFPVEEGETILNCHNFADWFNERHNVTSQIWRVTRYNADGTMFDNGIGTDHPSESQVKYFEPDEEIRNDGDLDALAQKIQEILGVKESVI